MKKRSLNLILTLSIVLPILPAMAVTAAAARQTIRIRLPQEKTFGRCRSIPTPAPDGISHQFTGVYDGNSKNITGMYVDKPNDDAGFFGYIGKGGGWGQNLDNYEGDKRDNHPHFKDMQNKPDSTTAVYRVTFKRYEDSVGYDEVKYVDPGTDINLANLKEPVKDPINWYVFDEKDNTYVLDDNGGPVVFDGNVTNHDVDAIAGIRVFFTGEEKITVTGTYSPEAQTLESNLDSHMMYENNATLTNGRFTYKFTNDQFPLNAVLREDGWAFTIPKGTNANETDGYTLTVTAHEKEPYIARPPRGGF